MTTQAPPAGQAPAGPAAWPDDPSASRFPDAHPLPQASPAPTAEDDLLVIASDGPQSFKDGVYTLERAVSLTWGTRSVRADRIVYDSGTGAVVADGHIQVDGGVNDEHLEATHADFNLKTGLGRFENVSGSVGLRPRVSNRRVVYTNTNPFVFSGRLVVKTGPADYDLYDGTVTSCQLPHPDWVLSAARFTIANNTATARRSTFRLLGKPIVYLPYVSHSLDSRQRQSGFLIPSVGQSSTRGLILGEQIYVTLGRSADLLFGAEYYSLRGFAQNVSFRYQGNGHDFARVRYSGLLDRRTGTDPTNGNQGGEDLVFAGRHDFRPADVASQTRVAANVEYLSSYIYREAFTENFNQAITSDVVSTAYGVHERNGFEAAALADRYQGIKLIARAANGSTAALPQQQVRIFHAPALSFATTDHRFAGGLEASLDASASGLKRVQPNFVTSGIVERLDVQPRVAYPFSLGRGAGAWRLRPEAGVRATLYTRSRAIVPAGQPLAESTDGLARTSFDLGLELRPPVLTRTFAVPPRLAGVFGTAVRHTVAPEFHYRLAGGIDSFNRTLRFDAVDIASNTDEIEYGVTQRLYRKRRDPARPCATAAAIGEEPGLNPAPEQIGPLGYSAPGSTAAEATVPGVGLGYAANFAPGTGGCASEELISWRLTQKYFIDPTFGGAIQNGRRNLFSTTLALSGVSFLTEAREISPLVSRLRARTSAHTDVEWDFDLDTGAKQFTSSNVFVDVHQGNGFAALGYARLDAPGRFYTQVVNDSVTTGVNSSVSDFHQLRVLLGYGNPTKRGLSIAGNTGLDLKSFFGASSTGTVRSTTVYPALIQYLAFQSAYNWNCCGVAFEYRQFQLGQVRNTPGYRFSFTLANVGTAGNLRRTERLF